MQVSMFREFSIGVVAENKPLSTTKIQVVPIEHLSMVDGDLKSEPTTVNSQGKDGQGNAYTVKGTMNNALTAEWLPGTNTNRRTAPDVRRGERVRLFRYADTDQIYWQPMGLDDHLRKGETVVLAFSGTLDEGVNGTLPENCWYLEVSTHAGVMTFQTSKKNGEYCGFTFQINAKEGIALLQDDLGDSIELDAKNTMVALINALGSSVTLDKKVINATAPDSINLQADNEINLQAKTVNVTATNANVTATTAIKGDTTITGTTKIDGKLTATSDMDVTGTIKCGKLISEQPIVAPNV